MDLGYQVVKTKNVPFWHKKDDYSEDSIVSPGPAVHEKEDEDDDKNETTAEKTDYPAFCMEDCPEALYDLPEEGTCEIRYRITRRVKTERDGKSHHSIEMDIMSINPPPKSSKMSMGERSKKAMEEYRKGR